MFICDKCLGEGYENYTTFRSVGKCEICEERTSCADIRSSSLRPKSRIVEDWVYDKDTDSVVPKKRRI